MYWIQTYSGKKFSYTDPQPESIAKSDIIAALSRESRYAGHTKWTYTVAQHSVYCSQMIDPEFAREAFAHDFAEAYIKDLPHPLKQLIREISGNTWRTIENRIMEVVSEAVGVTFPFDAKVKQVDLRMMSTERKYLLGESPEPWDCNLAPFDNIAIEIWPRYHVVTEMLTRWNELGLANPG